jgi:hypothetical protein
MIVVAVNDGDEALAIWLVATVTMIVEPGWG